MTLSAGGCKVPWALPRGSPRGITAPAGTVSIRVHNHIPNRTNKACLPQKFTGANHNKNRYDWHPCFRCGFDLSCYFLNSFDRTILHYFFFVPVIGIPDDLLRSNDTTIQMAYRAPEVQCPVIKTTVPFRWKLSRRCDTLPCP